MKSLRIVLARGRALLLLALSVALLVSPATGQPPEQAKGEERVDVLIGFNQPPGAAEEARVRAAGGVINRTFHLVPVIAANVPQQAVAGLQNARGVRYVELDGLMFAIDMGTQTQSQVIPWGIDRVFGVVDEEDPDEPNSREIAWEAAFEGFGMAVAVLDTGIDGSHEDLLVEGGTNTVRGNPNNWGDKNGHGTHVAGTIAALNNDVGVAGVAPELSLYAVKVLDNAGFGSISSVVAGIEWAVDQSIPVLNMSLGGGHSQTLKDACDNAYAEGHLLVAAAGNSGNVDGTGENVIFPAGYASVIAVAASDSNDNRAWFSSTGPAVELIAPGVGVLSTLPGNKYGTNSGTSMAAPHVAGAAALAWATAADLTNEEVRALLWITAEGLGLASNHQGWGLVRADLAVQEALSTDPADPPATGNITGTVTDSGNNPINGATVSIESLGVSTQSDSVGNYTLTDVPVGQHLVTASASGYDPESEEVSVAENETVTLNFTLQASTAPVLNVLVDTDKDEYQNRENVTITVTVTDDDQDPVSGATVSILLTTANGRQFAGSALTGSGGIVTFNHRVNANRDGTGTYTVDATASKDGYESGDETTFEVK